MEQTTQIPTPEGDVRRSGVLRQVIHYTLGLAHLARTKEEGKKARANPAVSDEGTVEARDRGGVDG